MDDNSDSSRPEQYEYDEKVWKMGASSHVTGSVWNRYGASYKIQTLSRNAQLTVPEVELKLQLVNGLSVHIQKPARYVTNDDPF